MNKINLYILLIILFFCDLILAQTANLSMQYYKKGRAQFFLSTLESYDKSASWYKKALKLDENNALILSGLAETYAVWAQQKRNEGEDYSNFLEKSLLYAKKSLELAPYLAESHRAIGIAYNVNGDYDAINELKKAIELNPSDGEAYFWLWLSLGEEITSKKIKKALKFSPYYPPIYSNLGIQYAISKDFKKARAYFKKALKLSPDNPYEYFNIATTYRDEGNFEKAVVYYKKSIEVYPNYVNALTTLSQIYILQKNYDESLKYLEDIIYRKPNCKMSKKINEVVSLFEVYLIDEIKNKKVNPKFSIREIQPKGKSGSLTLKGTGLSSMVSMEMEFPKDVIPVSMGFSSIPFGEKSIHRFNGTVKLNGYTFINEGSKLNRLTFAVLKNTGYTYIRGKGRVLMKDGREIKLGYAKEDKENLKKFLQVIFRY